MCKRQKLRPDCRDACHKAREQASTLAPLVTLVHPWPGCKADAGQVGSLSRTRAALQLSADRFVLMNDRPKKSAEKMRQEQRLRDALRENLKRRKAQVKGRATAGAQAPASHDSAGIAGDKPES